LERGWGRKVTPKKEWESYPILDKPIGEHWLTGGHTGLRVVAAQSYARSPLGKARLADIVGGLDDAGPINRVCMLRAVESISGKRVDEKAYTMTAAPAERARQVERLRKELCPGAGK